MNAFTVCEKPAVPGVVMASEGQIAFIVAHLVVGVLDQKVLKSKLLTCGQIRVWAVRGAGKMLEPLVKPGVAVVDEVAVGNGVGGSDVVLIL